MSKIPTRPAHPERVCWGCDRYCPADDLACGNGSIRTSHPCELFGDGWLEWSLDDRAGPHEVASPAPAKEKP
ncbi:MAG TPA: DUF3079 domain-containing protein [Vicinamibacterales bacterium]|nr:DUF3079 domain-containing protein [Vicinamibacterales bacterium]